MKLFEASRLCISKLADVNTGIYKPSFCKQKLVFGPICQKHAYKYGECLFHLPAYFNNEINLNTIAANL